MVHNAWPLWIIFNLRDKAMDKITNPGMLIGMLIDTVNISHRKKLTGQTSKSFHGFLHTESTKVLGQDWHLPRLHEKK